MTNAVYQEAILKLAHDPTGRGLLDPNDGQAMVDNPLCGDRVTMSVRLAEDGTIAEIGHKVRGCVLCEGTAAVIATEAPGLTPQSFGEVATAFTRMIRQGESAPEIWPQLEAFTPVHGVRSRHECVILPFQALSDALRLGGRLTAVGSGGK